MWVWSQRCYSSMVIDHAYWGLHQLLTARCSAALMPNWDTSIVKWRGASSFVKGDSSNEGIIRRVYNQVSGREKEHQVTIVDRSSSYPGDFKVDD